MESQARIIQSAIEVVSKVGTQPDPAQLKGGDTGRRWCWSQGPGFARAKDIRASLHLTSRMGFQRQIAVSRLPGKIEEG